jgi:hypothetical protein
VGKSTNVKREFPGGPSGERGINVYPFEFQRGYVCSQITGERQDDYYGEQWIYELWSANRRRKWHERYDVYNSRRALRGPQVEGQWPSLRIRQQMLVGKRHGDHMESKLWRKRV